MAYAFLFADESDTISLSQTEIISSLCFGEFNTARIFVLEFTDNCCNNRNIASKSLFSIFTFMRNGGIMYIDGR